MPRDLRTLPKLRDGVSYLYVEHCRVDQADKAIAIQDAIGETPVPCASLVVLVLGSGTTVTYAAVRTLVESGCSILWGGEEGVRCYAQGTGETRSARLLLRQVRLWSDPAAHARVVRRMYELRFGEPLDAECTQQQVRGREGARVRAAYARLAAEHGIEWAGRAYARGDWGAADAANRALSAANSCLYGVCHAAIVSLGCSPALGFIHTGKQLSFVYDLADLYKTELAVPVAFRAAAEGPLGIEGRVRRALRDAFAERRFLTRVAADLEALLEIHPGMEDAPDSFDGDDEALPGALWDGAAGSAQGGVNWEPADDADLRGEP